MTAVHESPIRCRTLRRPVSGQLLVRYQHSFGIDQGDETRSPCVARVARDRIRKGVMRLLVNRAARSDDGSPAQQPEEENHEGDQQDSGQHIQPLLGEKGHRAASCHHLLLGWNAQGAVVSRPPSMEAGNYFTK